MHRKGGWRSLLGGREARREGAISMDRSSDQSSADQSWADRSWAAPLPGRARPSRHRIGASRAVAVHPQARRPSSAAGPPDARPRFARRTTTAKCRQDKAGPSGPMSDSGRGDSLRRDANALWRSRRVIMAGMRRRGEQVRSRPRLSVTRLSFNYPAMLSAEHAIGRVGSRPLPRRDSRPRFPAGAPRGRVRCRRRRQAWL